MKKGIITLLIFILNSSLFCQTVSILNNLNNEPIPYANVVIYQNAKMVGGFYSNQFGVVNIGVKMVFDSVKISCLGYESVVFTRKNIPVKISLLPTSELLTEVEVRPQSGLLLEFVGFEKERKSQSIIASEGMQFVTKIENQFNEEKYVKSFVFYVRRTKTRKSAKAKIIFFENENGKPGKQLAIERVISFEKYSKQKIEVDFTETNLTLPKEGFFAGVEWIGCLNEHENESTNAEDCQLAIMVNDIDGQKILKQTYQRNVFRYNYFEDINQKMLVDLSMIPTFGIYVYE